MTPTAKAFLSVLQAADSVDALTEITSNLSDAVRAELADEIAAAAAAFSLNIADATAAEILAARPDVAALAREGVAADTTAATERDEAVAARDEATARATTLEAELAEAQEALRVAATAEAADSTDAVLASLTEVATKLGVDVEGLDAAQLVVALGDAAQTASASNTQGVGSVNTDALLYSTIL